MTHAKGITVYSQRTAWMWTVIAVVLVLLAVFPTGFTEDAFAATSGSPAIDASCSAMNTYGFTAGIVYCVESSIGTAVTKYVTAMQSSLRYYEGMMAAVAIIFFGFKMMNSNVQEPIKELISLVFRLCIGVFVFENAVNIYHWIAGTLPNSDGIINQAIGWVTGTGSGGSGNMFSSLVSDKCAAKTLPQTFEGYQVWQAFDCIFQKMLGAANPADHPFAFSTSMLVIIGATVLSGTLGVMTAGLGLTLFISAIMMVFRALYLVLMSYVCVGFMTLFAPLIGPMIFFESEYLKQKFMQWVGVIISCIFQPVLVIGFLAMAISIDDQFIEGNFSAPGCVLPTYPTSGSTNSVKPYPDWGQDGSGVCSFSQLFDQGISGASNVNMQTAYHNMTENNYTIFHQSVYGDPGLNCKTNNGTCSYTQQTLMHVGKTNVNNQTEQLGANAASLDWTGATRLKNYAPMRQLMLTLITFIFVTYAMIKLLDVIPAIAASITIGTGINLMNGLKVPFEEGINRLVASAQGRASQAASGIGIFGQKSAPKPTTTGTNTTAGNGWSAKKMIAMISMNERQHD